MFDARWLSRDPIEPRDRRSRAKDQDPNKYRQEIAILIDHNDDSLNPHANLAALEW